MSEAVGDEFQEPPEFVTVSRTLVFDSVSTLMYPTSKPAVEPKDRRLHEGMEHIDTTFVNLNRAEYRESRAFQGKLYLAEDNTHDLGWYLTGEEREYLGYRVMKATAELNSAQVEAWFAPEVPIRGGPGLYGGLPGLILMVTTTDGEAYAADSLAFGELNRVILPPTRGQVVDDAGYHRIRAAELAESRARIEKDVRDIREGRIGVRKSSLSADEIISNLKRGGRNQ